MGKVYAYGGFFEEDVWAVLLDIGSRRMYESVRKVGDANASR